MNNAIKKIIGIGFLFSVVLAGFAGLLTILHQQKNINLVSPTSAYSRLSIADNIWFPKPFAQGESKKNPDITAHAAFFVEVNSGEVLFEKSSHKKLPVASLVKVMTSIITLEGKKLDDLIKISEMAANFEPDKMFLQPGEKLTVEELLTGIFMVSGNDAAEALAESVTGRREEFINLMNSKARQLGMGDSLFVNPTGLTEEGNSQYSTAYDISLMSRYLIKRWPQMLKLSSIPYVFWPSNERRQDYEMYSGINLLTSYPGVVGLKTGFTPEAGFTLITVAGREDKQIIGVLLGATNRRDDAKKLLDYSFSKLGLDDL